MIVDVTKARDETVVLNRQRDPYYSPYCLRCFGMHRMTQVEPWLWRHRCGAEHDERQVLVPDTPESP